MTKKLTVSEIQSLRTENIESAFNREAVLAAHAATPARVRTGSGAHTCCSRLVKDIIMCLETVGEPVASNQLVVMLDANKTPRPVNAAGQPLDDKHYQKKLTDILWSLAGNTPKNQREKNPEAARAKYENRKVEKLGKGMYAIRA